MKESFERNKSPNKMNKLLLFLCLLSAPTPSLAGSHSFCWLATRIDGASPFPEFSVTFQLDDITVGHYNSEVGTYVPRENTTNEDEMIAYINYEMRQDLYPFLDTKIRSDNKTGGFLVYQLITVCEWSDNKPGRLIGKVAVGGSTTEEGQMLDNKFTYRSKNEITHAYLEFWKIILENVIYHRCIKRQKFFLEKRRTQIKKKVKPRVRLIQKTSDSGGFRVSCLATGFYPRHINLTLLRDGQPVSDHEVTGGNLLPNGDGTYQMRKSLEIRAEEKETHKYFCSATHLSLDNKLIVTLEFDPGEPFKSVIPSVLIVLFLVLVFITGVVIYKCRKRRAASSKGDYSSASTSGECTDTAGTQNPQQEATEISETLRT